MSREAAARYWIALADRPFAFLKSNKPIPQHWRSFGNRVSPLTNSQRKAITPFQACSITYMSFCKWRQLRKQPREVIEQRRAQRQQRRREQTQPTREMIGEAVGDLADAVMQRATRKRRRS
jgi:hypothetical protein